MNKLLKKFLTRNTNLLFKRDKHNQPKRKKITVTILGHLMPTGRMLALLLKQNRNIYELRLYGKTNTVCGAGIDLSHIDTTPRVKAYQGDSQVLIECIKGSNIIVICGGDSQALSSTQHKLFDSNLDMVRYYTIHIAEYNPKAILLVSTPPINSLVPMISEEFKKVGTYNPRKIIGLCNIASIRASGVLAEFCKTEPSRILVPTIGGLCPKTTVVVTSQATPTPIVSKDDHKIIQDKVRNLEQEIVGRYHEENMGSCYLSHAFAACRFIKTLVRGMNKESNCLECAYVRQLEHIGDFSPYLASLVKLGPGGVMDYYMPHLAEHECQSLKRAFMPLRDAIRLGQSVVTGEVFRKRRMDPMPSDYCQMVNVPVVESVGDFVVDLGKKYKNFEIHS